MASEPDSRIALAARCVTKRFPGVVANDKVDFEVLSGEVHALLGENGSGKTTLCKMLTGMYQPTAGHIEVDGEPVVLHSPGDAHRHGIFMVHQHFSLVERLTVAENVMLGWSSDGSRIRFNRRRAEQEVARLAEQYEMPVQADRTIAALSIGERQRVEILKAVCRGARVLILDEPTTVLTPQEAERLFASMRRLAKAGNSVIFISHKLHEVLAVSDRVSVLRRGVTTGTVELGDHAASVDRKDLARMMVGREIELGRRRRVTRAQPAASAGLEIKELVVHNDLGVLAVDGVTLDVAAGEVLGIAGVAGNGQREFAEAIAGVRPRTRGEVSVGGTEIRSGRPLAALAAGMAFVPEDRMGMGLASGIDVAENMVLKSFRTGAFSRGPLIRRGRVVDNASSLLEGYQLRGGPASLVGQLSGGNAQKVLLARELASKPRALVIAAPTRGLDVGVTETVRRLIAEAADAGTAVVMISEDLDEVLDLADRIAVMSGGRITGIVEAQGADVEEIGLLMMGQVRAA
ncbi:MAG TPA: ABC transporter ATP-binding protein [Solirubrobacteraceae bacterium]|nr:ABC transporter ATP-binding protein [Solirubrobacteraceae bacterium]